MLGVLEDGNLILLDLAQVVQVLEILEDLVELRFPSNEVLHFEQQSRIPVDFLAMLVPEVKEHNGPREAVVHRELIA